LELLENIYAIEPNFLGRICCPIPRMV